MKPLAIPLAVAVLAGCGGASPADEVRATARGGMEALLSDHPERACSFMVDHDACIGSVVTLKAMKLDAAATLNIPDDWRDQLERAKITVDGSTATLRGFDVNGDGKPGKYVLRGGRWLVDNR